MIEKTKWTVFLGLLGFSLLSAALGCPASPSEVKQVALAETFILRAGETVSVQGTSLVVRFLEVAGDSRCPNGEECLWEGDAVVRLSIQRGAGPKEDHDLHTSSRQPASVRESGHEIRLLRLDPQPVSGRAIEQVDYGVTLQVDKIGEPALPISESKANEGNERLGGTVQAGP